MRWERCPRCDSTLIDRCGSQSVFVHEHLVDGDVTAHRTGDWGTKLGVWRLHCEDCNYEWKEEAPNEHD